jgi:hypothetical protein
MEMSKRGEMILKFTLGLGVAIAIQLWLQSRGINAWHWFG